MNTTTTTEGGEKFNIQKGAEHHFTNFENPTNSEINEELKRVEKLYTKEQIEQYANDLMNPNSGNWAYREYSPNIRRYLACHYLKVYNT